MEQIDGDNPCTYESGSYQVCISVEGWGRRLMCVTSGLYFLTEVEGKVR